MGLCVYVDTLFIVQLLALCHWVDAYTHRSLTEVARVDRPEAVQSARRGFAPAAWWEQESGRSSL